MVASPVVVLMIVIIVMVITTSTTPILVVTSMVMVLVMVVAILIVMVVVVMVVVVVATTTPSSGLVVVVVVMLMVVPVVRWPVLEIPSFFHATTMIIRMSTSIFSLFLTFLVMSEVVKDARRVAVRVENFQHLLSLFVGNFLGIPRLCDGLVLVVLQSDVPQLIIRNILDINPLDFKLPLPLILCPNRGRRAIVDVA